MAQTQHEMLPRATHDEAARQDFVQSFKIYLANNVSPGNREVYDQRVKPQFEKEYGREPKDRHEVRKAMSADPFYRLWSSLQRTSQEMMWDSVCASVDRQIDDLVTKAKLDRGAARGSLRLNPSVQVPHYHAKVDIHCQPGGYHTELGEDDVAAGAIYDRAVYIYTMGRAGPMNADMGESSANFVRRTFPDFKPQTILDMGCTVGHSTLPWVDAYPESEVFGIDVGAPVLRYAHARAEALGKRVHYSQQNAEQTDFEDESFDLIVSQILVHETSSKAIKNIMKECHRLLRPGGKMVHLETPPYAAMNDAFEEFIMDWDTYYNNEPFWGPSHEIDYREMAANAGFNPDQVRLELAPSALAEAAGRTGVFQCGDFAGAGEWFLFIAEK
ncbi:methyltransferase domain-containing protein [Algiphilus sp.]|uniref:class I SAM-dependent methyltransferase n=1 Tax=Algiphilus sp. TaxID=1872431 RepID=UPI0032EFEAA8